MTLATSLNETETAHLVAQPFSKWRLLLISSAALYLEIVLIRWLGTEVKIFAFFQNLSLIVCFLGFGVGCFSSKKRGSILPTLFATTALVVTVSLPFQGWRDFLRILTSVLSYSPDAALWGSLRDRLPLSSYYVAMIVSLCAVTLFLALLCSAMIPLGRWVGFYLEAAPNTVSAYSINLLGSLVGIWLLAILAFLWLSPAFWFTVAFALILLAQPVSWRSALVACVLLVITLLALRPANKGLVYWSPYQKLSLEDTGNHQYVLDVNNTGYMPILNSSPEFLAGNPQLAMTYWNNYESLFQFARNTNSVLVIGSGAGNDIPPALRHGASRVDAVEIDPLISTLGLRLNPDHPYSSPKVHLINNDARNFLRQCRNKYDVIIFGALDSHTEFSGYSNLRVDNYVYTEESFRDARRLLNPDGILVLKFTALRPWTWTGHRFYAMFSHMFPHPPLTYYTDQMGTHGASTAVFIESDSPYLWETSRSQPASAFLSAHPPDFPLTLDNAPPPTTDDWPYVYNFGHSIPRAYFAVSAIILAMAILLVGPVFSLKATNALQFFLLGAGFLLMETQMVSRLALYFGTTWLVNCIALTGILTVLVLSNFYVEGRRPENLRIYYAGLCATLLLNYWVPWEKLPASGTLIGVVVCFAYCVPFFFAGIIFTESFRRFAGRSDAFGANMLGAVAGGLAQNLSFIFGMKALLIIAAAVYGVAALLHIVKPTEIFASNP